MSKKLMRNEWSIKPNDDRLRAQIYYAKYGYFAGCVIGILVYVFAPIPGLMIFILGTICFLSQKMDKIRLEVRENGRRKTKIYN